MGKKSSDNFAVMEEALLSVKHGHLYILHGGIVRGEQYHWWEWYAQEEDDVVRAFTMKFRPDSVREIIAFRLKTIRIEYLDEEQKKYVDPYRRAVLESAPWSGRASLNNADIKILRDEMERRFEENKERADYWRKQMLAVLMVWAYEAGKPFFDRYEAQGRVALHPKALFMIDVEDLWFRLNWGRNPEVAESRLDEVLGKYNETVHPLLTKCQRAGVLFYYDRWKEALEPALLAYAGLQGYEHTLDALLEGIYHEEWLHEKNRFYAKDLGLQYVGIPDSELKHILTKRAPWTKRRFEYFHDHVPVAVGPSGTWEAKWNFVDHQCRRLGLEEHPFQDHVVMKDAIRRQRKKYSK